MSTILIVPAAGLGSRLGSSVPKLLHPVGGAPMLDHLTALYRSRIDRWVIVCRPDDDGLVRAACERLDLRADVVHQHSPTGMLDAILVPLEIVGRADPDLVWITWADQIAIHPLTVARLASTATVSPRPALVMPTALRPAPYIHFERDGERRITAVRQRREGDVMPEIGETDCGLFSLTRAAYTDLLPLYAADASTRSAGTGERNFLPFVPWLQARDRIETFPSMEPVESLGVNTPGDQAEVETCLAKRRARPTS